MSGGDRESSAAARRAMDEGGRRGARVGQSHERRWLDRHQRGRAREEQQGDGEEQVEMESGGGRR